MKVTKPLTKTALIIISVLFSLLAAEFAIRFFLPDGSRYYVWQPNLRNQFHPDSGIFHGINGTKNFSVNSEGLRGKLFQKNRTENKNGELIFIENAPDNVLFLGGSTTECLYLDDKETWWYLWDSLLETQSIKRVSASMAKSGITTRELYLHMKYAVSQVKYVDEIVIMPGLNDLMKRLSADTLFDNNFLFTPQVEDSLVKNIFLQKSRNKEKVWWRRIALFGLVQNFYHKANPNGVQWMIQDDRGESLKRWRENRQKAVRMIDSLPDLTSALIEYRRNLELIYAEARKQHIRLSFITQPVIYKDSMTAYEQCILWMGGKGAYQQEAGKEYYSAHALKEGMKKYNEVLLSFCNDNEVDVIEATQIFPKDTSVFYDDCHFNEYGARLFAEYLSRVRFQ